MKTKILAILISFAMILTVSMAALPPAEAPTGLNAICVPWIGMDPSDIYHYTYFDSGGAVAAILKGIVRGGTPPYTYEWDFGDGSPVESGAVTDPYAIEAIHTYVGSNNDMFTATLRVTDNVGETSEDDYLVILKDLDNLVAPDTPLSVKVNKAIDDGLWYLHKHQTRYGSGGVDYGYWEYGAYDACATGSSVEAFEFQGHKPDGDYDENPYVETVQRGLNSLFTFLTPVSINLEPAGDPDTYPVGAPNGIGLVVNSGQPLYETGMVLPAIVASGTPDAIDPVFGRTYEDIAGDIIDYFAWAQCDGGSGRGGWRYGPYDSASGVSDNSVTSWPILGLYAAEYGSRAGFVDLPAPDWVKTELEDHWLTYSQHADGWFGYSGPDSPTMLRTGAGMMGFAYCGVDQSETKYANAIAWMGNQWYTELGTWPRMWYSMYNVMKASRMADPNIDMYGPHDWYEILATEIVGIQNPDGSWPSGYRVGGYLGDAFCILILQKAGAGIPEPEEITVYVDIKPGSWPNPLNVESKGVLPVAVCGTEDFDVTTIDPETIRLTLEGIAEGVAPLRWSYEDVATPYTGEPCSGHDLEGDGYLDLTLKFNTQEVIHTLGLDTFGDRDVVIIILTGNLKEEYDGTAIQGQDCVVILNR